MQREIKTLLLAELETIDGVEAHTSPVSGGTALFYQGREFAHFHNGHELDLRLTKKVIHRLGLTHTRGSGQHPDRTANSPWIVLSFHTEDDIERVSDLVKLAVCNL
jgi:hypothetical protein